MAGAVCGRYPLACRLISAMAFTPVFFSPRSWEFFWRDFGSPSGRCSFTARIFSPKSKRRTGARWPRLSETTIGTAGDDRTVLLERLREVFRFVGNPTISVKDAGIRTESARGFWRARITIKGTGEFAPVIEERVNSLPAPFELEWRRGSSKPWDWKLVRVENAALEISNNGL